MSKDKYIASPNHRDWKNGYDKDALRGYQLLTGIHPDEQHT